MNVATLKKRITQSILNNLDRTDICGPDWDFDVKEPHPNSVRIQITAPNGVIRYLFEVKVSQKERV